MVSAFNLLISHIHVLRRLSKTQQSLALMTLLRCTQIAKLWIFSNEMVLQTTWFFAADSGTNAEMSRCLPGDREDSNNTKCLARKALVSKETMVARYWRSKARKF